VFLLEPVHQSYGDAHLCLLSLCGDGIDLRPETEAVRQTIAGLRNELPPDAEPTSKTFLLGLLHFGRTVPNHAQQVQLVIGAARREGVAWTARHELPLFVPGLVSSVLDGQIAHETQWLFGVARPGISRLSSDRIPAGDPPAEEIAPAGETCPEEEVDPMIVGRRRPGKCQHKEREQA